jgi:predicted DNA-binding transcriptional regulator AlpA
MTTFIGKKEAAQRAGLSVSTIKRLEKLGDFPDRVQIAPNRVGYVLDEFETWIAQRIAQRDSAKVEA